MAKQDANLEKAKRKMEVEEAITKLRSLYAAGKVSLRKHPSRVPNDESSIEIRLGRKFADRFSTTDLQRLISLSRKHCRPVGLTLLERFVSVGKADRDALQEEALREKWSRAKLGREIHQRFGRRLQRGRRPKQPTDVGDAVAESMLIAARLIRWGRDRGWNPTTGRVVAPKGDAAEILLSDLPEKVGDAAKVALRAGQTLHDVAEQALTGMREPKKRTKSKKKGPSPAGP